MEKINNEYTFTEASEKMVDFLKLMGDLDKDFKLPDPAECLIDELERRKKLLDEFNKLQKEHEEQKEKLHKTTKKLVEANKSRNALLIEHDMLNKHINELSTKNKKLDEKCKQLEKEKDIKLSLSESLDKSEKSDVTLSNTFISSLAASYERSEKEKEEMLKRLQDSNTMKNILQDKVASQEEEIKTLKNYINSIETKLGLNNNLGGK